MLDKNSPFAITPHPGRGESLSSLALTLLGDAIVAGDLPSGALVSEVELSARFAIGLAATRAALARLAARGWIAAEGRKGWRVLPISAGHLADLQASRDCLERALPDQPPPAPLRAELLRRAQLHRANLPGFSADALFHQERDLLALLVQVLPAPRLRAWLADSWDLALRADRFLNRQFGIDRGPLPLPDLAEALAHGDGAGAAALLARMRAEFADRCTRALCRSDVQISSPPAAPSAAKTMTPHSAAADAGRQQRTAQQGEPK